MERTGLQTTERGLALMSARGASTSRPTGPMHRCMQTTHHGTVEVKPRAIIEQIRHALESGDLEAIAGLYAEDATLEELSSLSPPAHPTIVRGREAILQHL